MLIYSADKPSYKLASAVDSTINFNQHSHFIPKLLDLSFITVKPSAVPEMWNLK